MVPFGGFLLLGGRAGDILGRRRVLVAGTACSRWRRSGPRWRRRPAS